jgi:hypothetical protein
VVARRIAGKSWVSKSIFMLLMIRGIAYYGCGFPLRPRLLISASATKSHRIWSDKLTFGRSFPLRLRAGFHPALDVASYARQTAPCVIKY